MTKLAWAPWHKVVKIRPDLKSGELSLNIFAADLYDVAMGKAKPVYQDAHELFSLTYPTYNLRELAKDVVLRLAGKSEKAVRQLELTYGGGKTHSLITLWPLVAANSFLTEPGKSGISEAARELTTIAATEGYEGKKQEWTAILEGELDKARDIQAETRGLRFREIEQAVFATFLHSQPIGQKVLTRELMGLLGPTRPDKIELEKGLVRWSEVSWFLDEGATGDVDRGNGGAKLDLPR